MSDVNRARELRARSKEIVELRTEEEKLREEWKDNKDIFQHWQTLSLQFPRSIDALTIDEKLVKLTLSKGGALKRYFQILVKRVDLLDKGRKSFRIDITIFYGVEDKGIINVDVSKAFAVLFDVFGKWFNKALIRIATEFKDGSWTSSKTRVLKEPVSRIRPRIEGSQ